MNEQTATAAADEATTIAPPAELVEKSVLINTDENGHITAAFPDGEPEALAIPTAMFKAIVADMNAWRDLATAQQLAISAYALGNRPGGKVLADISEGQHRFGISQ